MRTLRAWIEARHWPTIAAAVAVLFLASLVAGYWFAERFDSKDRDLLARETLQLSARGLVRRKRLDRNGRDETRYLRPLEESIARGITPAEELLEKFDNEWRGSVEPIFDEYSY